MARLGTPPTVASRGARNRRRQRFVVRCADRSGDRAGRAMPTAARRGRRDDHHHATAACQSGPARRSPVSVLSKVAFSQVTPHVDDRQAVGPYARRAAGRTGEASKNLGYFSLTGLVRVRSDSPPTACLAACMARVVVGMDVPGPAARRAALVVVAKRLPGRAGTPRGNLVWHSTPLSSAMRYAQRWHGHFVVLDQLASRAASCQPPLRVAPTR